MYPVVLRPPQEFYASSESWSLPAPSPYSPEKPEFSPAYESLFGSESWLGSAAQSLKDFVWGVDRSSPSSLDHPDEMEVDSSNIIDVTPKRVSRRDLHRTQIGGIFSLSSLDGNNGFRVDGVASDDQLGGSVSTAGDVNGDGVQDIIIGAERANPDRAGVAYVIFGQSGGGFNTILSASSLDGSNGFRVDGVASQDRTGHSVSAAGDVNGDGVQDIIIGAYFVDLNGMDNVGSAYVVFGQSGGGFNAILSASSLDGSNGFRVDGVASDDIFRSFSQCSW